MKRKRGTTSRRVLLAGTLLCIALVLASSVKYRTASRSDLDTHLAIPKPPLVLQNSRFPCLDSLARTRLKKRLAVLHGPDWTLESFIESRCFPEREVVLSVEVGRHFLSRSLTQRVRFWIARKGDAFYVKVVESSGSEQLDNSALDLVTNHKCMAQNSKNCYVQSARIIVSM